MNQLDIFSQRARFPRARRSDPSSSQAAADELERSGRGKAQADAVLMAVHCWPNCTSAELSKYSGIPRHVAARRLPELAAIALIIRADPSDNTKPCEVSGIRCVRWRPA